MSEDMSTTLKESADAELHLNLLYIRWAAALRDVYKLTSWTDDATAELRLLGMNLHNLSVELSRQHPCAATILEGYANQIDELMARAPEAVSPQQPP